MRNALRIVLLLSVCLASVLGASAQDVISTVAGGGPYDMPAADASLTGCPSCFDFNPCTVDSCDATTGTCRHDALDCDDGNSCTVDSCDATHAPSGGCIHSDPPIGTACNNGNSCSAAICISVPGSASQCDELFFPAGTVCNDGNSCTTGDTCDEGGRCVGVPSTPGASCDDRSLCTSGDTCVTSESGAVLCQGTARDCGDGNLCTQDLCNPATGQCSNPPINCDDGNACTQDSCDQNTGTCRRDFLTGSCNDGTACTPDEQCLNGNCTGGHYNNYCDDNVHCTVDTCDPTTGACIHTPNDDDCPIDPPCQHYVCVLFQGCILFPISGPRECDRNSCTYPDMCFYGGICQPGANVTDCNDGNPCTNDFCIGQGQCYHGTNVSCNDGNPCTIDSCDPAIGCTHEPFTGPSTNCDHSLCTSGDVCIDGTCTAGAPVDCEDGNVCTTDTCSPGFGCLRDFNNQPCDDNNVCTNRSSCVGGRCEGPENACDDGNRCTTDSCDPVAGCGAHTNNTDPCDDGNPCTAGDMCSDGVCHSGTLLNCDDGNACTADRCTGSGCEHNDITGNCIDGNFCTIDQTCNPATGCVYHLRVELSTCGVGACRRTVDICASGELQPCVPGTPTTPEVCNGMDDNCNSQIDEGLGLGQLSITLTPPVLWPPNHRMVDLHAAVTVAKNCPTAGQTPIVVLAAVTSNEPDDASGGGDGNTINDIQEADLGTADFQLKLRSERDGAGSGRVYTLTYAASDSAGNSSSGSAFVLVPHDQHASEEPIALSVVQGDAGTGVSWAEVPGALLYGVVRGDVRNLQATATAIDLGPVTCIEADSPDVSTAGHEDLDVPSTGEAFFYLVAYNDGWGTSGYGTASTTKPRVVASGDCR